MEGRKCTDKRREVEGRIERGRTMKEWREGASTLALVALFRSLWGQVMQQFEVGRVG